MPAIDQALFNFNPQMGLAVAVMVGFLVFAVALDLTWEQFRGVLRKPKAPAIGLVAQVLILPGVAFGIGLLMADTPSIALGLLLVACCPAGALSNYLTGVARGSVAIERTQSGLARARAEGKALGRPRRISEDAMSDVQGRLAAGETISAIAKAYSTSRQTIMRIRGAVGAKGL